MGLNGLTRLGIILGSIGVGEAWPYRKFTYLDGLEPCGLYGENSGRMEVADKCFDTREVLRTVGG